MEQLKELKDRIRWLVDTFHQGSVKRASQKYGLLQPTLSRITNGILKSPRVDILQRIATYHGTTVDWLITGAGPMPSSDAPANVSGRPEAMAAYTEYSSIIRPLVTTPATVRMFRMLPSSSSAVGFTIRDDALPAKKQKAIAAIGERLNVEAFKANSEIWARAIQGFVEELGVDDVAIGFAHMPPVLARFDSEFIAWLQARSLLPEDLGPLYNEFVNEQMEAEEKEEAAPAPNGRRAARRRASR